MQQRRMGPGVADVADILGWRPMTPWEGPPLPFKFRIYWPWCSFACPVCHERVYKYTGVADSHFYAHYIDGDITYDQYLDYSKTYGR